EDEAQVIGGGRLVQRLASAPAIAKLIEAPMGPDVRPMSDAEILADFRARSGTVYHPVSTCRMGASAETAVIDAECRVFGVEGLRVVDASSFPNITSGNTNAPTMMLAHRAADLILGQGR
ncbi:MAG: choline dehydrogenase, partial [Rhodobacteraceae bacterium]|nr:choline dehydrogenase [Paracoccaceae bacterium]